MSLKNDFNAELKKLYKQPNELDCLNALIKTLKNGNYPNVKAEKTHQKYVTYHVKNNKLKREICDVFVVFRFKDHLRFSFIQNKIVKSNYQGLDKFKIEAGQHCFLVTKPYFNFGNKTSSVLINSNYETITAYSVFYKTNNGDYDFDFSSANSCLCHQCNKFKCCTFKKRCVATHVYNAIFKTTNFGYDDFISLKNANEIEQNPFFGEVIKLNDKRINEIVYLINSLSGSKMLEFLKLKTDESPYEGKVSESDTLLKINYIVAVDMMKVQ